MARKKFTCEVCGGEFIGHRRICKDCEKMGHKQLHHVATSTRAQQMVERSK